MVGYALSRLQFWGRNLIFYIIIFTMTLPFQITLIPQYILMVKFTWVDTYLSLMDNYCLPLPFSPPLRQIKGEGVSGIIGLITWFCGTPSGLS